MSVRELKTYIDDHYRADPGAVDPVLFPDAAQVLADAQAKKGRASRVVHITYDHRVPDAARDEKIKTYGAQAWQRADGQFKSKSCEYAQPGFVAAGPGRGEAFLVCVSKEKCPVHWRDWQRERERRQKERAAQQRRVDKADRVTEGRDEKTPAKPAAPEPELAFRDQVLSALIERLYPGILKAAKQTLASLKLPDEILWNVTLTIFEGDGFDWQKPPKRPSWGGSALDDFGIWEAIEAKLRKALGGAFGHDGHHNPTNVAGARTALAIEICLSRDFDAGGIEKLYDRELDTAWKAELKRRATEKAKAVKSDRGKKKPTVKKRTPAKAKKR